MREKVENKLQELRKVSEELLIEINKYDFLEIEYNNIYQKYWLIQAKINVLMELLYEE